MVLTRIWSVLLAVLATGCLAGMFMLSAKSTVDFSAADESALRAVTEAGVAAIEAEIARADVRHADDLLQGDELNRALARDDDAAPEGERTLADILAERSHELRETYDSDMTIAIIDDKGQIKAVNGIEEAKVSEFIASQVFVNAPKDGPHRAASVTLGGELFVGIVTAPNADGFRAIAFEALNTGAGSLLRRVVGSTMPAALVRGGKMVGDLIGDQPLQIEIEQLSDKYRGEAPESGASKVFTIGEGINARIGALGRVPGPAGRGNNGLMLAVLSGHTAAAGQQDLAEALASARAEGGLERVNWILLVGLLVVCAGLGLYLPSLEGLGPMHRLSRELTAIAQGAQHSVFHDRYSGAPGEVARSAAAAHEALRQAYLAELEIDEEEVEGEADEDGQARPRPRTARGRRLPTRGHRRAPTGRRSKINKQVADPLVATTPDDGVEDRVTAPNVAAPLSTPPPPSPAPRTPSNWAPAAGLAAPPTREPIAPPMPAAPPPRPTPSPITAPSPASPVPPAPPAPPAPMDADDEVEDDEDPSGGYYREVYEEFLQVKMACGEPTNNFSFDKFAKKLAKQTSDIQKKRPDAADVKFSVYVKDGRAALKARIVRA